MVFLPALRALERRGHLSAVNEWWGTSAGSLCAALYALTRSVERVEEIMRGTDYLKFRDVNLMNFMNIHTAWGLDDGRGLMQEIEVVLDKAVAGASHKTMRDVSGLNIVVADLNVYETVVCSAENYPTLRVAEAIRASMSLPIFYTPFKCPTNGHVWVDGGLRAGFPWDCLPSDDARREALGFAFERSWMNGPTTFMEYIFSMVHFDDPVRIRRMREKWSQNILWFQTPPFPPWYMRLRDDDFTVLEDIAKVGVERWVSDGAGFIEHSPLGIQGSSASCAHPSTPSPVVRHGTGESSESRRLSRRTLLPPSQDSQSGRRLSFRRWSL